MRKNRGETLIESLISMFFVTVIIVPVANLFLQTFKTDIKVDNLNEKNVNIEIKLSINVSPLFLLIFPQLLFTKNFKNNITYDDKRCKWYIFVLFPLF